MAFGIHIGPNIRKSPFFDATVAAGVRSFSVYNHMYIPGSYGDPEAEYDRLINGVALWDVAAQRQVEIAGPEAERLVQRLSTRDISTMVPGQGRYVCLCDASGALLNDPVLLKLADDRFWLSIADSDVALWASGMADALGWEVTISEPDVSPLAVQGPTAGAVAESLFGAWVHDLKPFWFRETRLDGIPLLVARSGWSKQGGFELYLQEGTRGTDLWQRVAEAGAPFGIGPGAPNDVERIESGLVSYGADMRRQCCPANPFEMGLGWLVDLDKPIAFVGRPALERIRSEGANRRRSGIVLEGPPISPNPHPLTLARSGSAVGLVSEVAYSPRLEQNIGLALIEVSVPDDARELALHHDGIDWPVTLAPLPFIGRR